MVIIYMTPGIGPGPALGELGGFRPPEMGRGMFSLGESVRPRASYDSRLVLGRLLSDMFTSTTGNTPLLNKVVDSGVRQEMGLNEIRKGQKDEQRQLLMMAQMKSEGKSAAQMHIEATAPTHPDFPETDMKHIGTAITVLGGVISGIRGGGGEGMGGKVVGAGATDAMLWAITDRMVDPNDFVA